ncbi:DUF2199 domain-containing protein [Permianibacter aggregans]|uniref:DUF2199 domain-containing protein n=1 Tax=Permianibacter aggregans TaxID=1510150 RepID=A0A4R6URM5_9GAMM|nr:DUF2199 domain-containing protein [Permianibacter aggregans]QGX39606.1 DUF2199 domain-containing protein [Permianibacter aggregans]TDQ49642.1 hypothetical protein EV696_1038 [Permianibacter aggregans]
MDEIEGDRGFYCESCGERHEGLTKDFGFQLPDEVWNLSCLEDYLRSRHNKDFCTLDENRFFIRGILQIPFTYEDDSFGWGLWVEISREDHQIAIATWETGADEIPEFEGRIANEIAIFGDILGQTVHVKLFDEHRPLLSFPTESGHLLAKEQRDGISLERHHEYIKVKAS